MRKSLTLLLLCFFLLTLFISVFGKESSWEVSYPEFLGGTPPETGKTGLPQYFKYVYYAGLALGGLLALGALLYGGFRYLTSAGNPTAVQDATDQIFAGLFGFLILMASWLILNTINPQLIKPQIKVLPKIIPVLSEGVYLCKEKTREIQLAWEEIPKVKQLSSKNPDSPDLPGKIAQINEWLKKIEENCWRVPTSGEIIEKFNDKVKFGYIVPSENNVLHGVILYNDSKFGGRAQVDFIVAPNIKAFEVSAIKPSSVKPFILKNPRPGAYVELFELVYHNADKEDERYSVTKLLSAYSLNKFKRVGSVKIEGELFVIFFKDPRRLVLDDEIDVVLSTDHNLYDNRMGRWCREKIWEGWSHFPCPKQMMIISGGIY